MDAIIDSGKAEQEAVSKLKAGRPIRGVTKRHCMFYLPEDMVRVINENCRGNKSYFAEEVFRYYFDAHKIKY